jgi:predicted metal-dependent enzyme (double-stranded beta helix superfamily)
MTPDLSRPVETYSIDRYLRDVSAVLDRDAPLHEQVKEVAIAKKKLVSNPLVLPADLRRMHPTAAYTRNLIHHDPRNRFTVIAIIWGPFQETAVHDHINWCVVGVLEGNAHVTNYDRLDDGSTPGRAELCVRDSFVTNPGAVAALLPPPRSNIHRMANGGRAPAITIHTYGDPGTKATAFDIKAGTYQTIDLKFHNLEEP